MSKKFIDEMIELAKKPIAECECEIIDAEFVKEGSDWFLRFYIERLEGKVSLEDCAKANTLISEAIDNVETIHENFILEVSSPGVNRVIKTEKDFIKFQGSKVDVSLYKTYEGYKKFVAVLEEYTEGKFIFVIEEKQGDKKIEVKKEDVGKINLYFDFKF